MFLLLTQSVFLLCLTGDLLGSCMPLSLGSGISIKEPNVSESQENTSKACPSKLNLGQPTLSELHTSYVSENE